MWVLVTGEQSRRASLQLRLLPLQPVNHLFVLLQQVGRGILSRLPVICNLREKRERERDIAGKELLKSGMGCGTLWQEAPFSPVAPGRSWGDWSCGVCTVETGCWPGCSSRCLLHVGVWSEETEPDSHDTTHNKNSLKAWDFFYFSFYLFSLWNTT